MLKISNISFLITLLGLLAFDLMVLILVVRVPSIDGRKNVK